MTKPQRRRDTEILKDLDDIAARRLRAHRDDGAMRPSVWVLGFVLSALSNCSTATAPSHLTGTLAITPDISVLKAGETQVLLAVLRSGLSESIVTAAWSGSDASVLIVDDRGLVSARSRGTATITARYTNQETSQRLLVVPDLSGRWAGRFFLKLCSQIAGPPPSPCRFGVDGYYPFVLTIAQTHNDVTGTLTLFERGTLTGGLHGTTESGSALTIQNQDLVDSDRNGSLTDWHSVVDFTSGAMDGTFSIRTGNASIFGAQVLVYGCEFNAVRDR